MSINLTSDRIQLMKVRTRMAPSPTGEYHIGHIRTLLYNWAFAKKHEGQFIVRIEDTDRERFVEGAIERILGVIRDFGLKWDEGPEVGGSHGPYVQSQRLGIYQKHAQELVDKGSAYLCFCTTERLTQMREEQKRLGSASTKYDRRCLSYSKEQIENLLKSKTPYVIRLKVPDKRTVTFKDMVYGEISVESKEIDDQVLIKSDGFPTYHMAVVIDDHLMGITHIMRGIDWLPSTPKHILLYEAFGWEVLTYIHLPNLKELGATKKLSKRYGPVSAREFLDQGYLPEAILNFLMFLGWNPGTEKEFYTLEEFTNDFSIERIHKTDLVAFDRQKLDWMNGRYIEEMDDRKLGSRIWNYLDKKYTQEVIIKTVPLVKSRIKKLSEYWLLASFFFQENAVDEKLLSVDHKKHLGEALKVLEPLGEWELRDINIALNGVVKSKGFETGKFYMDFRVAIAGARVTPPINESIVILGKETTLKRIKRVL